LQARAIASVVSDGGLGISHAVNATAGRLPTCQLHVERRSAVRWPKSAFAHPTSYGLSWIQWRVC